MVVVVVGEGGNISDESCCWSFSFVFVFNAELPLESFWWVIKIPGKVWGRGGGGGCGGVG